MAALTGGVAGAVALSPPVHIHQRAAPRRPARPRPLPAVATPAPSAPKPSISFAKTAKKIKLSRKGTFTLTFTAPPGLKGTYTFSAIGKKGRFTADKRGVVKLTIKGVKHRKKAVKVKITAVAGRLKGTATFTLRS